jgi:hypothetical protein
MVIYTTYLGFYVVACIGWLVLIFLLSRKVFRVGAWVEKAISLLLILAALPPALWILRFV